MGKKDDKLLKKIKKRHIREEETELDIFEDQKFVDDIPLEDLKIEQEQEKDKHKTQDTSQSERKFKR